MSRLIDADALRESIITRQTEMSYEDAWALTCVDNAPTIEAQQEVEALAEAYDGFPAQVTIKDCRDCTINVYPSQTKMVEYGVDKGDEE